MSRRLRIRTLVEVVPDAPDADAAVVRAGEDVAVIRGYSVNRGVVGLHFSN